jgi:hypothetical protein
MAKTMGENKILCSPSLYTYTYYLLSLIAKKVKTHLLLLQRNRKKFCLRSNLIKFQSFFFGGGDISIIIFFLF